MYKKYWLLLKEKGFKYYELYGEYTFFLSALIVGLVSCHKCDSVEIRCEKWHWTIKD